MSKRFEIPIVLFIFRRYDTVLRIIDVMRKVQPLKVYLLSDEGRTKEEKLQVQYARKTIEESIDWDCEVIKRYASENIGVLNNIGLGAKWVFEREDKAIFLEDDNLPAESFFSYCEDALDLFEDDQRVLWVCGTNYLKPDQQVDYKYDAFFSQHMLPCGWASWSKKYRDHYDAYLESLSSRELVNRFYSTYEDNRLANEQYYHIAQTKYYIDTQINRASWDYQMLFTLRSQGMYGIVPVKNQIRNIGVDEISEHGGTSLNFTMTSRFCELQTYEITGLIRIPSEISTPFERALDAVLLPPIKDRIKRKMGTAIKKLLGMNPYDSLSKALQGRHG